MTLSGETLIVSHSNNTDIDQPAHLHRLNSALAFHSIERITALLAACKNSIFYLVNVAGQIQLSFNLVDCRSNLEDRFSCDNAQIQWVTYAINVSSA